MPRTSQQEALTTVMFAGVAVLAAALAAFTFWVAREQDSAAEQVSRTHEVLAALGDLRGDVAEFQSGPRGFVITGRDTFLARFELAAASIAPDIAKLREITAGDATQQALLDRLAPLIEARLKSARELVETRRTSGFAAAAAMLQSDVPRREIQGIRDIVDAMAAAEQGLLDRHLSDLTRKTRLFWLSVTGLAAVLAIVLTLVYAMIRRRQRETRHARFELEERVRERTHRLDEANQRLLSEIDDRRVIERELREARLRIESFSRRLIRANEDERRRIARDLHDQTMQSLSLMLQNLRVLRMDHDAKRVEESLRLTEEMVRQVRDMSLQLRPAMLDDLGLDAALEWLLERQGHANGWKTNLEVDSVPENLSDEVRTECFRIAQEALNNAAKHAQAANVSVSLKAADGQLTLVVRDDGKGFGAEHLRSREERSRHFGMVSMSERADLVGGRLEISPAPGGGTQVGAVFPLRVEREQAVPDSPAL